MVKISVIVPVYNVEKYIDKCLNSLVNQTYKNLEIIVVNDGTKDNSQDIIDDYKNKYENIKSFIKPNGGISDARNYGIKRATGQYIAFVDSDDYIESTMYEKLYNGIKDADISVCDTYIVKNSEKTIINPGLNKKLQTKKELKKYMLNLYPTLWNKLYKKELFNDIEFKRGIWFEDVELLYRLHPKIRKINYINEPLYYYVQREGSITSKVNDKIYNYIDNWNSIIKYYKDNNLFDFYKKELEYCYVRYIYATFIKRTLSFNYENYIIALNKAITSVKDNFPNYRMNSYFYKSFKGVYLVLFNKFLGILMYRLNNYSQK